MIPLFEVKNFSVHYGVIQAVKDLNFKIKPGQILSLIGSNGAGKTSTLKGLSGLTPSTGNILFKNQEIQNLAPYERARLGIAHVPEGRGIFLNLTVKENLQLGDFKSSVLKKELLEKVFEFFPVLKNRYHQISGTLSGGEQQMLAIARASIGEPTLFFLDEPSLGLAPQMVNKIFEIILEIKKAGKTVILVEQNAHQALQIADWAIVLENGSLALQGVGLDLLKTDRVKELYLGG